MMLATLAVLALGSLPLPSADAPPQGKELAAVKTETVAPGLEYSRYEAQGLVAHVTRIDLHAKTLHVRSVKSKGKESLRELAERLGKADETVLAGINGDYFRMASAAGLPFGAQVCDGGLCFGPMNRSMVSFGPENEPFIGVAELKARIAFSSAQTAGASTWFKIDDVNQLEQEDQRKAGIYLYTPAFLGLSVNRPKGTIAVLDTIQPALQIGDVCTGRLARVEPAGTEVEIPENGCLLYFFGEANKSMAERLKPGLPVALKLELPPVPGNVMQALGGGPRLVRNGRVAIEIDKEDFEAVYAMELSKRNPRSAIGFDQTKKTLWLVMVEGRTEQSRGMTFAELGAFMDKLGCFQAMAFDGGGSSGMYIEGKGIVSRNLGTPAKPEERELANALFITSTPAAKK